MRRIIGMVAALVAVFAIYGVGADAALAGCTATGGASSWRTDGVIISHHKISCTTNNGPHYQMRAYVQGDFGGWHTITPAITTDYYSPITNFSALTTDYWSCGYLAAGDVQVRAKTVVENMSTGSLSVGYGPGTTVPTSCQ